jgi:hypothetical protein
MYDQVPVEKLRVENECVRTDKLKIAAAPLTYLMNDQALGLPSRLWGFCSLALSMIFRFYSTRGFGTTSLYKGAEKHE